MPSIIRTTPDKAGCWIDGNAGDKYANLTLISLATDHGWDGAQDAEALRLIADYSSAAPSYAAVEYITGQCGLIDEIVNWMNDKIAPNSYQFGWCEGDFMLCHENWWTNHDPSDRKPANSDSDRLVGDIRDDPEVCC